MNKRGNAREVFKVTEWKDGCVYRTKSLGFVWLNAKIIFERARENEIAKELGGDFLNSVSTKDKRSGMFIPIETEPFYEH